MYYASARAIKLVQNGFLHDYLEKGNVGEELFIPCNWDGEKNYTWGRKRKQERIWLDVIGSVRDFAALRIFFKVEKEVNEGKMLTEKDLLEIIKKIVYRVWREFMPIEILQEFRKLQRHQLLQ